MTLLASVKVGRSRSKTKTGDVVALGRRIPFAISILPLFFFCFNCLLLLVNYYFYILRGSLEEGREESNSLACSCGCALKRVCLFDDTFLLLMTSNETVNPNAFDVNRVFTFCDIISQRIIQNSNAMQYQINSALAVITWSDD